MQQWTKGFSVASAQTDNAAVAAVTGRRLRVLGVTMQAGGTDTTVVFNSKGSGAGTAISQTFTAKAGVNTVLPYTPTGYGDTASGEALTVTTGTGSSVAFEVVYGVL